VVVDVGVQVEEKVVVGVNEGVGVLVIVKVGV
jgi:hypothetical protein